MGKDDQEENLNVINNGGQWYDRVPDVLTAEALAAQDGVAVAANQGCEKVVLEVDNQLLAGLLRSEDERQSCSWALATDPRVECKLYLFSSCAGEKGC